MHIELQFWVENECGNEWENELVWVTACFHGVMVVGLGTKPLENHWAKTRQSAVLAQIVHNICSKISSVKLDVYKW